MTISVQCRAQRRFDFDPNSVALLIIDMQHDFLADDGACGAAGAAVARLQAVIPRVKAVLGLARARGILVVYTRYGFKPDLSDLPEAVRQQSRDAGAEYGKPGPMGRVLVQGEAGHEIIEELAPRPEETVIDKSTFSAFTFTSLSDVLQRRHVTHLWIAGVTTQCCVEGTIRDAVDRGYYVLTIEDACGAFEPELQEGTLRAIQSEGHLLGWITDSDRLSAACQT